MRAFLGLFIAAVVSTVSGSFILSARQYPACALTCMANANPGSCLSGEVKCLCTDSTYVVSTTQCIESSCNAADIATAESIAQQTCEAAGVTLTSSIPPATSTSPAASSATAKTSTPSSSSSIPSAGTAANKSNGAASNAVNIIGGAAALGLTALML